MVVEVYYHPHSPPSALVRILIRELGIEYEEKFIDFWKQEHQSDEYKKINPHMQIPAIKDGDLVLTESRAIAIYLCTKYEATDKQEKLYPTDPSEVAKMNFLIFRNVDNYSAVYKYGNGKNILTGQACGPDLSQFPKVEKVLAEYEALVAGKNFMFCSHFTVLDIIVAVTLVDLSVTGYDNWEPYPNIKKWRFHFEKKQYFDEIIKEPFVDIKQKYKELCEKSAIATAQT